MTMTPYERIKAMTEGREVDRPGVSVWKHFFLDDRYALDHALRSASFQDMGGWDFIKIMTTNVHMEAAFGSKVKWSTSEADRTRIVGRPAKSPKGLRDIRVTDWAPLDKEVEVAKLLVDRYHGKVPVICTVDLPASYVKSMYCGFEDPTLYTELIRNYQDDFQEGIKILTEVTVKLIEKYTAVGVDGFFLPTNVANSHYMTAEEYKEYCLPSALTTVQAAADSGTWFNMLHIHGDGHVFFDELVNTMPVNAINWHSVTSDVSLADAAAKTDKILIGGLDHMKDFQIVDRDEMRARIYQRVDEAAKSAPANRLIIAPGCSVVPPSVPDACINVLKQTVDAYFDK